MIGYSILANVISAIIKNGLVKQVYHSVEIYNNNGERFPGYRHEDEWLYVGIDDTKFMNAYIREIKAFQVAKVDYVSSGGEKVYTGEVTYRLVVFNDFEDRNHDDLLIGLMEFTFFSHVKLKRLITNTEELLKEEAKVKQFTFGATTFYKAIDFTVTVDFVANKCGASIGCGNWPNPIDKDNMTGDFSVDFNSGYS